MSDTFKIIIPAQLEKSADGEWKVHGLASTNGIDKQGETIIQKGIDLSPVDEGRGILNWDHDNSPENIIGVLDGYKQTSNGLYVNGRLFKNHDSELRQFTSFIEFLIRVELRNVIEFT